MSVQYCLIKSSTESQKDLEAEQLRETHITINRQPQDTSGSIHLKSVVRELLAHSQNITVSSHLLSCQWEFEYCDLNPLWVERVQLSGSFSVSVLQFRKSVQTSVISFQPWPTTPHVVTIGRKKTSVPNWSVHAFYQTVVFISSLYTILHCALLGYHSWTSVHSHS